MIKVSHKVPSLPEVFHDAACDVASSGALMVYDRDGKYVRTVFAPGMWFGFEFTQEG